MMKKILILSLAAIAIVPAGAQFVDNGGFEALPALSGWSTSGTVFRRDYELSRDFLPPVRGDWEPTEGDYFASLWSTDSAGSNSSTLSQSFTAFAGQDLSFDYFFDFGDVAPRYDTAVATITGPEGMVTLFEHNTPGFLLDSDENVEWTPIEYTIPSDGSYTLSFRTVDFAGDFESILGVDNVVLIPEPAALFAVLFAALLRRR